MTFRRSSTLILKKKKWHQFCLEHRVLIEATGLPLIVFESWEHFEDFLMHGYLDHHPDPVGVTVDVLTRDEKQALNRLKQCFEDKLYT